MAEIADAVAGTLVDLFGQPAAEAAPDEEPNSTTAETSEGAPEAAELPDDIEELLNEPDLDIDDEEVVDTGEYQDADELARELARVKKRAKWLEEQNLAKSRKEWKKEARKYFPYAEIDKIDAGSRRAFLRAARDQHDQIKARVAPILAEERKRLAARETVEQQQAREAAAAAWGKPVTGGAPAPATAVTTAQDRLDKARARRDLFGAAKVLAESGALD